MNNIYITGDTHGDFGAVWAGEQADGHRLIVVQWEQISQVQTEGQQCRERK